MMYVLIAIAVALIAAVGLHFDYDEEKRIKRNVKNKKKRAEQKIQRALIA